MKRVLATILSVLYLALSSSAVISIHYCGGELESIQINSEALVCCCETETSSTCCHDEELKLELDNDQYSVSLNNIVPENLVLIAEVIMGVDILQESEIEENAPEKYIKPPPIQEAIWLLNCSLTYYG